VNPEGSLSRRPIPLLYILLLTAAVHGPLLLMQLPARTSYDTNFHIFFASHYASHWFQPWNEKWFAGFSQTTYPPLSHQLVALLSYVFGLNMAYALVQFFAVALVPVGVYRFAKLWVDEVSASYAALGSVFLGCVAFLVYSAGQLPTTLSAPLYLNALPYFYEWSRYGKGRALIKGVLVALVAAGVHHVTLLFGAVFFAAPVLWLAWTDERRDTDGSGVKTLSRAAVFVGVGWGRNHLASLLVGNLEASDSTNSHSARQPVEFAFEFLLWVQLLYCSLRRFDFGFSVRSMARRKSPETQAVADCLLVRVHLWTGRHHAPAQVVTRPRIRHFDL
jgi:hypothetical protein